MYVIFYIFFSLECSGHYILNRLLQIRFACKLMFLKGKKKKRLSGCVCHYVPFCSVYHFSASLILLQPCHKRCLYSKPIILPKAYINSTNNFGKFLLHHTCVPLLYPRRVDRNLEEKIPVIIRMLVEYGLY
jgi:hypothetical protein